jgi:hypothetical protein
VDRSNPVRVAQRKQEPHAEHDAVKRELLERGFDVSCDVFGRPIAKAPWSDYFNDAYWTLEQLDLAGREAVLAADSFLRLGGGRKSAREIVVQAIQRRFLRPEPLPPRRRVPPERSNGTL